MDEPNNDGVDEDELQDYVLVSKQNKKREAAQRMDHQRRQ